jgi:hypothetical protein
VLMNSAAKSLRDKRALQPDPSASNFDSPSSLDDALFVLNPDLGDLGNAPETVIETGRQKSKKSRKRSKKRADSLHDSDSEDSNATTHDSSSDTEEDIPMRLVLGRKTSYELEKEENIARNKLLLEATFGKELEEFQSAIGSGVKGKGKGKGKEKSDVDERTGEGRVTRSKAKGPATESTPKTPADSTTPLPPALPTDSTTPIPPAPPTDSITPLPLAPPTDLPLPQPPLSLTDGRATSRHSPEPRSEGEHSLGIESPDGPLLGAPEWVTEAMEWLQDDALGEEWALCVRAWWYFEKVVGGFAVGVRS